MNRCQVPDLVARPVMSRTRNAATSRPVNSEALKKRDAWHPTRLCVVCAGFDIRWTTQRSPSGQRREVGNELRSALWAAGTFATSSLRIWRR